MRRSLACLFIVALVALSASWAAAAVAVIEFDAVSLRPANDGTSGLPWAEEYSYSAAGFSVDLTGMRIQTTAAGQKAYYGTNFFNGRTLSDIGRIEFTFSDGPTAKNAPYSNVVITNGLGAYGIVSSQGGRLIEDLSTVDHTIKRWAFDFADNGGNAAYGFRFYEPVDAPWAHGTNVVWDDIKDWYILDTLPRPLSAGEVQFGSPQARGPVDHSLVLTWGDSEANYIGYRQVWDVAVYDAAGNAFWAGVPEPASLAVWSLLAAGGLVATWRRWRRR
ncbi:MAG: PEP-CTERM sorting domain-containing protein [Pirellulales bacterium]|nr:PEP-CTERM sorting domain-containing protein [Pirellulales bacterium]